MERVRKGKMGWRGHTRDFKSHILLLFEEISNVVWNSRDKIKVKVERERQLKGKTNPFVYLVTIRFSQYYQWKWKRSCIYLFMN